MAALRQEDVGRLQIPVHDALLVRRGQRLRDLAGELHGLGGRQGTLCQPLLERLPLQQLHDGVGDVAFMAENEDGEDVGVGKRCHGPGLPLEPCQGLGVVGDPLGDQLHRHLPPETCIPGAIDLPHATGPQLTEDLVGAETRAKPERHGPYPLARSSRVWKVEVLEG